MSECLHPSVSVLCALGSVLVHVEEALEPGGHPFDIEAVRGIASNPEIIAWREQMDSLALLPKKRLLADGGSSDT